MSFQDSSVCRKRITIDGNIGSGKTTQVNILQSKGYSVLKEPIHEWPLDLFYTDKNRWAFLLQMAVLHGFEESAHIYERSPDSSLSVFWNMMKEQDIVNNQEDYICRNMYNKHGWQSDLFIYIDVTPEKCYNRINYREQEGDKIISVDYLRQLDTYYKMYIQSHPNVRVVSGDRDADTISREIISIIENECSV